MSPIIDVLTGISAFLIFIPSIYLAGIPFAKSFSNAPIWLSGAITFILGMIAYVFWVIVIGSAGWIAPSALAAFFILPWIFLFRHFREPWLWLRETFNCFRLSMSSEGFVSGVFILSAAAAFILCFLPETANDALCYQLNVPKEFLRQSSLTPNLMDPNSFMPMAMNCFYMLGLALKCMTLAKLFHWFAGLLIAGLIANKCRDSGNSGFSAVFLAVIFWLTPAVINQVTTTYVDVAAALFLFVGLLSLEHAFKFESLWTFFGSGLIFGAMIAVKFSLLIAGLPLILSFFTWGKGLSLKTLKYALILAAGAAAGCGYWFIRNYLAVGNPVFPYFGEIFGTIGFKNYSNYLGVGVDKSILNFFLLPWYMTFKINLFGSGAWVGPAWLLIVPGAFFAMKKRFGYFIFACGFTLLWFMSAQITRYLIPVLPIWFILSADGLDWLIRIVKQPAAARFLRSTAAFGLVGYFAVFCYHYRHEFTYILRAKNSTIYLKETERSFSAAEWVNKNLPGDSKILNAEEIRQFYFMPLSVREASLNFAARYADNRTPEQIVDYLKQAGFTHVMLTNAVGETVAKPERLGWIEQSEKTGMLVELVRIESQNIREAKHAYRIYKLA